MACTTTFMLSQPKEPQSAIRIEVRYTPDIHPFAFSKQLGRRAERITGTIPYFRVAPADFLGNQGVKHKAKDAAGINAMMHRMRDRVADLHKQFCSEGKFPTPAKFKEMMFNLYPEAKTDRDMWGDMSAWIEHLGNTGVTKKFIKDCERTQTYFKSYVKHKKVHTYADISTPVLSGFERYLRDKPRIGSSNTVKKYIDTLRQFLKFAQDEGWHNSEQYKSYSITETINPFPVTLTEEEVLIFYQCELSHYGYRRRIAAEMCKDLFVFACQTGQRYSDWGKGEVVKVRDGYNLRLTQQKTLHPLEIPLSKLAVEILEKYKWKMPKPLTETSMLQYLQEIATHCGIGKKVTTHTARRTCATLLEKQDVPRTHIMRITGHKTESSYLRYVGVTYQENASSMREKLPAIFKIV
jgi:integrase